MHPPAPPSGQTWQIAAQLARSTARDRIGITTPMTLSEEVLFLEPVVADDIYRPRQVAGFILNELPGIASRLDHAAPTRAALEGHCQLTTLVSFLDNLALHLKSADDRSLLAEPVGDRTAEEVLLGILRQIWMQYRDADLGLLFSVGQLDAFELPPGGHPDAGATRCAPCYLNLYFHRVLRQLLEVLDPRHREMWAPKRDQLGVNLLQRFWDAERERLRTVVPIDPDSPFAQQDWNPTCPHTLALFLASGLGTPAQNRMLAKQLQTHMDHPDSGTFGMAMIPAPPPGITSGYAFRGWTHVPGGNHTQMCARSARFLHEASEATLAGRILDTLAVRAVEDGGFFPWYTPDHCPQGARPDPLAARAFLNALALIRPGDSHPAPGWRPDKLKRPVSRVSPPEPHLKQSRLRVRKKVYDEHRRARRLPIELHGHLRTGGMFSGQDLNAAIRFPSMTGMMLQTSMALQKGRLVRIRIETRQRGQRKCYNLKARVVWSRPRTFHLLNQCGVELTSRGSDFRAWRSYMEQKINEQDVRCGR